MVPVIDPDDAETKLVVRVFRSFAAGQSVQAIADTLNREGIEAPHDGGKGNKGMRGCAQHRSREMTKPGRSRGQSKRT